MGRADAAGGEQIVVARAAARSPPRRSRAMSSGTTRTSASLIPCRLSQVADLGDVAVLGAARRGSRRRSPAAPAVQIRSSVMRARSSRLARCRLVKSGSPALYRARMDTTIFSTAEAGVIGRHGAIKLHGPEGFAGMRAAGRSPPRSSTRSSRMSCPGVTTAGARRHRLRRDDARAAAMPATLGYRGYTKSCCTSINHVVCHGIPGDRALKDGDIVNIDVTPILDGWHGDTSRMYPGRRRRHQGDEAGRGHLRMPDARHRAGQARQPARRHRPRHPEPCRGAPLFGVVRDFCGHGLGRVFHDAPEVVHAGRPGTGPELRPGMFFTIEPMINIGKAAAKMLDDGWTAVTRDRSLSAQFEHSDRHHRGRLRDLHQEPEGPRRAALLSGAAAVGRLSRPSPVRTRR